MPPKKKEVKFEGDAAYINANLKTQLEERDRTIIRLENKHVVLERCYTQVYLALEEAEGLADRFPQFVQDAAGNPQKQSIRTAEMARYSKLFHEAKGAFQRSRA